MSLRLHCQLFPPLPKDLLVPLLVQLQQLAYGRRARQQERHTLIAILGLRLGMSLGQILVRTNGLFRWIILKTTLLMTFVLRYQNAAELLQ